MLLYYINFIFNMVEHSGYRLPHLQPEVDQPRFLPPHSTTTLLTVSRTSLSFPFYHHAHCLKEENKICTPSETIESQFCAQIRTYPKEKVEDKHEVLNALQAVVSHAAPLQF